MKTGSLRKTGNDSEPVRIPFFGRNTVG